MWGPGGEGGHHKFKRGAKFSFEATFNIWCQRKNHVGSKLPRVLLNTHVVCFLTLVKSLNSEFCRVPIFASISSISLQQRKYEKIYSVHSKELAESYTLIPVTIFRVAGWGESKFSLLTTMPILVSIFLISIQKIAYILENGGGGGSWVPCSERV